MTQAHFGDVQIDSNGVCVSEAAGNFLAAMLSGIRTAGGPTGFPLNVSILKVLRQNFET
jgi:hypothetical protein